MRIIVRTTRQYAYANEQVHQILPDQDHPMMVTIAPYVEPRSRDQNALFHALMRDLARQYSEHYGEVVSPEAFKVYLKRKFLGQESQTLKDGTVMTWDRHTADLKKPEMTAFISDCKDYCALELGINLDEP